MKKLWNCYKIKFCMVSYGSVSGCILDFRGVISLNWAETNSKPNWISWIVARSRHAEHKNLPSFNSKSPTETYPKTCITKKWWRHQIWNDFLWISNVLLDWNSLTLKLSLTPTESSSDQVNGTTLRDPLKRLDLTWVSWGACVVSTYKT